MENKKKRTRRQRQKAVMPKKCSKDECNFTHLGGMSTPPWSQFYQCVHCGRKIST